MNGETRFRFHPALSAAALLIALTISIVRCDPALALGQECMAAYYRTKSTACVDGILTEFRQKPRSDPNTLIGFLAELFKDSPQERDRVLSAETADYMKSIDLASLWLAGEADKAQKFADANNLSSQMEQLRKTFPVTLDNVKSSSLPRDNDLLIGAYMASGNADFIRRILANYSDADDAMVADALRIGFMMSKLGRNLTAGGRNPATLRIACEKYQCKVDSAKTYRLLTLATAIWAIQSLSQQDDGIRKTLDDFVIADPRLKTIFVVEQTAFGNYLMTMVGAAALRNPQADDQQRALEAMNKAALIYENLGSAAEASAAMVPTPPR
jgi:hypothetical protein